MSDTGYTISNYAEKTMQKKLKEKACNNYLYLARLCKTMQSNAL